MYCISPILTTCVYQNVTGRPCPLCGGTRFISGIKDNLFNLSYYNCPFGYTSGEIENPLANHSLSY